MAQQRPDWPAEPDIDPPSVVLWWARADDWRDELAHHLTPAEGKLMQRMLTSDAKRSFALGRVMTRLLVARLTDCSPHTAVIREADEDGGSRRPEPLRAGVSFSLSRSGRLILLATGVGATAVGVDLQRQWAVMDREIAAIVGARDAAALRRLTWPELAPAVARQWARREAVLKLTGEGLRVPPSHLRMTPATEEPRLLYHPGQPDLGGRVTLTDLPTPDGYQACLAVASRHQARVAHRRFTPST